MKKITSIFFSIFIITFFSCSEVPGEFGYMNNLKQAISEKYKSEKVEINIKNNNELIISLLDKKFDNFSFEEKAQISREIGSLAQELRKDKEKIKKGVVKFKDEENFGILKTTITETFQMYQ